MSLQNTLDTLRAASQTRIPPETRAVMERSVEALRASGIMDRVVRVGQPAPDFSLPDADGASVALAQLRAHGPVVLSFYRGRW